MQQKKNFIAFEAMMRASPYEKYDSGFDGICKERRTCRFHRPLWKHRTCVFRECPYSTVKLSTTRANQELGKER